MALTTTALNSCDVVLELCDGETPAVAHDISGSSNSIDLNFDHEICDFRVFGSCYPGRLECGKDASVTLNIVYSSAADEAWSLLRDWYYGVCNPGQRCLHIYIPNKIAGADHFWGDFFIQNLSWTLTAGDACPIMVTASLLPDGEVHYEAYTSP